MLKSISASDLRTQIKRILNEVGDGRSEYVVEKFGEPIAVIISMEDFHLLQTVKQEQQNTEPGQLGHTFLTELETIHQILQAGATGPAPKQRLTPKSRPSERVGELDATPLPRRGYTHLLSLIYAPAVTRLSPFCHKTALPAVSFLIQSVGRR